MSGINGYLQFNKIKGEIEIRNIISLMNKEVTHRGPDGEDIYTDNNLGLGVKILSRGETSSDKHLIYNEDKTIIFISDGLIFNYDVLKNKLQKLGHSFSTQNSIEVIVHAYEEYGEECLKLVDGMFSIALYDMTKQKVVLARDRVGQKPFYYYKDENILLFGSELKALLITNLVRKEINRNALEQYFQLTYIPAPNTIFKDIYKINPGCYLKVFLNGKVDIQEYWDLVYDNSKLITDYHECKRLLREAVFSSVEERMKNNTSIGAFLSGGIDSTIIVGIMSLLSSKPIDTFTIGFNAKAFDESNRAQLVADKYKTNHHVYFLDYDKVLEEIDKIINQLDEPFADSSAIPTYMVAKYASQYVDTVLTGDSGDELFAGYSKYLIGYYSALYKRIPYFLRKSVIEKLVHTMPDSNALTRKIRKVIDNASKDIFSQRKELMCLGFKEVELSLLLKRQGELDSLNFVKKHYDKYKNVADELFQTLYTDFKVVLEGDMMPKVDRMATLSSLETRVPLLSKEIIQLAAYIPSKYKINNKSQKIILKDTFSDIIPHKLLNASKRGFGVPIGAWFKNALKNEVLELLDEQYIMGQGLFNYKYIHRVLDEHFTEKKNRSGELWALYVFQRWYRRYFDI